MVGGGRWWTVVGHGGLGMGVLTTWRRFPLPPSNVLQVLIFPRIQITFLLFALYDRKLKVQIGGGGGGVSNGRPPRALILSSQLI